MKTYRLLLLPLLMFLGNMALGQNVLDSMHKLVYLQDQGKFREAIPVVHGIRDYYFKQTGKPFDDFKDTEAELYAHIGDYSKAEQILTELLLAKKNDPNGKALYQHVLYVLSGMYEKMGNDEKAKPILEDLIITEYATQAPAVIEESVRSNRKKMTSYMVPDQGNKEKYFATQIRNAKKADSARLAAYRASYDQLLKKPDTGTNHLYRAYYKTMMVPMFDSVQMTKTLEQQWEANINQRKILDSAYQKSPTLNNMLKMDAMINKKFSPPTSQQADLLRKGELKFSGERVENATLGERWNNLQHLFAIYKRNHQYKAAEALIKQAIFIDDKHTESTAYKLMNTFYTPQMKEMLAKADSSGASVALLKRSEGIYHAHSGEDIYYLQNKVLLTELYKEMGRDAEYKLLADTVYTLCKKLDNGNNQRVLIEVAKTYAKIGKYQDAIVSYKKVIDNSTDIYGKRSSNLVYAGAFQELAKLYKLTNKYDDAEAALQKALDYDKSTMGEQYPVHLDRVIEMAQLYENTGNFNLAEQYCTSGIGPVLNNLQDNFSFLSEQEKILWINTQISSFDFSASLLITNPHPSNDFLRQTYDQQLQLKGLVLNDEEKTFQAIRRNSDPKLKKLLEDWRNNKASIAWFYSQRMTPKIAQRIDSLRTLTNDQEKQINQLSASFGNSRENSRIDFKQIQKQLKSGEAAIEFVRFNYYHKKWTDTVKYAAFVARSGGAAPHLVLLCDESQLFALLDSKGNTSSKEFVRTLYGHDTEKKEKGDALYNTIWQPLDPYLKGIKKIAIAPAGLLNRVAFGALSKSNDTYLVDQYQLNQYGSTRQIAEQGNPHEKSSKNITAVLYGGITYDDLNSNNTAQTDPKNSKGSKFPSLPGTRAEVDSINRLFMDKKIATRLVTGAGATEESLKQLSGNSPTILHIATHGFSLSNTASRSGNLNEGPAIFNEDPLFRSGVIMAGGNRVWTGGEPIEGKEDGIVTAYEISNIDFSNTDLVVLSACETALGEIKGTEGVFGLQRAFKYAGTKNLLLSLWNIPDEQTTKLMKLFYTNKLHGMSNYEALNSAQHVMRKTYAPYYWASFVLIE